MNDMKLFRLNISAMISLVVAFILAGCARVEEPDYREKDYGYVQFKLYKEASYPGTKATHIDFHCAFVAKDNFSHNIIWSEEFVINDIIHSEG